MTKVAALQGEFFMMILLIPSLINNEGDQQIIIGLGYMLPYTRMFVSVSVPLSFC